MTVGNEKDFKSSNNCWICNTLFAKGDNKIRDHDHVIRKYRRSVHWDCNTNLKFIKKISVIFHNLRDYGSHLIMQEIGKFDVKINVMPNELENYMTFTGNRNLVFIDSMQLINSSLDGLV